MYPHLSISSRNASRAIFSSGFSGYILQLLEASVPSFRSMAWSYFHQGGRSWEGCSSKTLQYSRQCSGTIPSMVHSFFFMFSVAARVVDWVVHFMSKQTFLGLVHHPALVGTGQREKSCHFSSMESWHVKLQQERLTVESLQLIL